MKHILVLGAGKSTPYLINYLLERAEKYDWFITVGDVNKELTRKAVGRHPRSSSIMFDVNDTEMREAQIAKADVVVNFLPPTFQYILALDCIKQRKHMITASYQDIRMADINADAQRHGVLVLNEMGLDPGIDHMSAMSVIQQVKKEGAEIEAFRSYGSGLPAPDSIDNPLKYAITWNPRNVVMAGETGAQYLYKGKIKILPWHEVFQRTWRIELEGIGTLEAYPNRDSMLYMKLFGLEKVHTMIRGTLRYPGWSETWLQVVRLGLPNESIRISGLRRKTYRELVEMFLPLHDPGPSLEQRVANFLNISPTGNIMEKLQWLGLFSDEKIRTAGNTSAEVLADLLSRKLQLTENQKDMVAIVHELTVKYPGNGRQRTKIRSTMIEYGKPGGFTAIAKTVGLPAAIATKLLLTGELPICGCHIPTHQAIYTRVLPELEKHGIIFKETRTDIEK